MNTFISLLFSPELIVVYTHIFYFVTVLLLVLIFIKKSDRRANYILESMDESFMAFDNNWRFTYVNKRAAQFLDYRRSKLIGESILEIFPEFDDSPVFKKYLQAKRTRKPVRFEYVSKRSNRHYGITAFPSSDGLAVYFFDITKIKRTEEKARASEMLFRNLADHAPVLIWMSDVDGNCNYFNQQWLDFTGRKLEEEIGEGWKEGIHPEDLQYCLDNFINSFEARIEFQIEYRLKRFDGSYRWVVDQGSPMYDGVGNFIGFIGSCFDITDRKEIEQRKDEFISIASHELKTPVTSIKAFTQLLMLKAKNKRDKTPYEYLKRMDGQINNLSGLISDLLNVSKIEQGKLMFKKEDVQFDQLLQSVISDLQETAIRHKIELERNDKTVVFGDRERLCQVLINLIDNAIKYSPEKDEVIVSAVNNSRSLTISVRDFGVGIPKEKQEFVFDRFYRVGGEKSETFAGLGLGLFISAEIVRRHGGRIWVESLPGEGSTFYFNLPIEH